MRVAGALNKPFAGCSPHLSGEGLVVVRTKCEGNDNGFAVLRSAKPGNMECPKNAAAADPAPANSGVSGG